MIINTGDEAKCRQINLMECPACGEAFELMDGPFVFSTVVGLELKVCPAHAAQERLTEKEEACVKLAFDRAVAHPRGRLQVDCKLIKVPAIFPPIKCNVKTLEQLRMWKSRRRMR